MNDFGYCQAWPDGLKELYRRYYRATCRLRNLEAALDRIDPIDFDALMDQIEQAQQDSLAVASAFGTARRDWLIQSGGLTLGH